jgi:hypothetical protein
MEAPEHRWQQVARFLDDRIREGRYAEPDHRKESLLSFTRRGMDTFQPSRVLKLGRGPLETYLASLQDVTLTVVDPRPGAWREGPERHGYAITGNFHTMPVDYYRSEMTILVDLLPLLMTGPVLNEVKRVTDFDSHALVASPVLHEDDLEGVLDTVCRRNLDIHNDLYHPQDLHTSLVVKGFEPVMEESIRLKTKLADLIGMEEGEKPVTEDEEVRVLEELYGYDGEFMEENYFMGIYRKKKPDEL